MDFRTVGAIATLLIGLGSSSSPALAQYYPAPQAYPPPPAYPPPQGPYRVLPPDANDDAPRYDAQGRPLPPAAVGPQANEPPPVRWGRRAPVYAEEAEPPPPGTVYRDVPPGYRDAPQQGHYRDAPPQAPQGYPQQGYPQQGYPQQGYPQQGYEPAAAGTRPYYGGPAAAPPAGTYEQDATRPPLPINPEQAGPGQVDPRATGATRGDPRHMAALPPEVRPETGPKKALPPQFRRALVDYYTKEPAGTLIIDTPNTYLYLVLGQGKAMRYGIGVGREGFTWAGAEKVSRMAEWPDWNPPEEMIERQPYLPRFMAGGDGNPLGARALYLGKTLYRIHGTNQPSTIGTFVSSGCIRLTNEDITDLYTRVKVGTRVVVLPGKPPAPAMSIAPSAVPPGAASAAPPGAPPAAAPPPGAPPAAGPYGGPAVTTSPLAPPPSAMAR
jgi:lipoprotein-anchoring transpeptidase ErfK/SrfK